VHPAQSIVSDATACFVCTVDHNSITMLSVLALTLPEPEPEANCRTPTGVFQHYARAEPTVKQPEPTPPPGTIMEIHRLLTSKTVEFSTFVIACDKGTAFGSMSSGSCNGASSVVGQWVTGTSVTVFPYSTITKIS